MTVEIVSIIFFFFCPSTRYAQLNYLSTKQTNKSSSFFHPLIICLVVLIECFKKIALSLDDDGDGDGDWTMMVIRLCTTFGFEPVCYTHSLIKRQRKQ